MIGCRERFFFFFSLPKVKHLIERAPAKLRKLNLWPGLEWRTQARVLASSLAAVCCLLLGFASAGGSFFSAEQRWLKSGRVDWITWTRKD